MSPARIAVLAFAAVPWMAAASPFLKGRVVDDSGAPIANARVSARPDPGASAVEAVLFLCREADLRFFRADKPRALGRKEVGIA